MEDTIAAVATAFGEGGIGIIRISGIKSPEILKEIFVPINKAADKTVDFNGIYSIVNRRFNYGHIVDPHSGKTIEEVLTVYMKAPYTYTAEDVVEINCHGSIVSLRKVLELVLRCGARMAEPGEFTKRAFLNGRLDLSQAEAVIDLIKAKSDKNFEVALNQLEGALSKKISEIRKMLMDELVSITVNLDYPDEDIEEVLYKDLEKSLLEINDEIEKLILSADTGRILNEGFNIAIVGKPNVGKSSLMNALMKESRAIVTDIPGTTRDTIEENISIKGVPVTLIDTAGIHHTEDVVEKIGIEKSKESFNKADLIILILDGNDKLYEDDNTIIETIGSRKAIVLLNKNDLGCNFGDAEMAQLKNRMPNATFIKTAVKDNVGIEEIENTVESFVYNGEIKQTGNLFVTNVRHKNLLISAHQSLKEGIDSVKSGEALDFIEIDVKRSWEFLGEILGETVSESIIDEVFARFCLGK